MAGRTSWKTLRDALVDRLAVTTKAQTGLTDAELTHAEANTASRYEHAIRALTLSELRERAGCTQAMVADAMLLTAGGVSRLEQGQRRITLRGLHTYAAAIGADVDIRITIDGHTYLLQPPPALSDEA